MAQLEPITILEIFMTGAMLGSFISYVVEEIESITLESLKPYTYSSNIFSSKRVKNKLTQRLLTAAFTKASWKASSVISTSRSLRNKVTKPIDFFSIWSDNRKPEVKK